MANPVKKKKKKKTVKFSQLAAIILSKKYIMTEKIKKKKNMYVSLKLGKAGLRYRKGQQHTPEARKKGGLTTHRTVPTR